MRVNLMVNIHHSPPFILIHSPGCDLVQAAADIATLETVAVSSKKRPGRSTNHDSLPWYEMTCIMTRMNKVVNDSHLFVTFVAKLVVKSWDPARMSTWRLVYAKWMTSWASSLVISGNGYGVRMRRDQNYINDGKPPTSDRWWYALSEGTTNFRACVNLQAHF